MPNFKLWLCALLLVLGCAALFFPVQAGVSNGGNQVAGQVASGFVGTGPNPVLIAGQSAANQINNLRVDGNGAMITSSVAQTLIDGVSNTALGQAGQNISTPQNSSGGYIYYPYFLWLYNGVTWDRVRTASIANLPTSQTFTGVNSQGVALWERGGRWSKVSNPASGSQASASIALESSVRHIADCVSFSANASGATAATQLTVNLRDGATGAGTIIWTYQIGAGVLGLGGTFSGPFQACGLNLTGTTATAMTLEFSAGLTGLVEAVSLSGYNVN